MREALLILPFNDNVGKANDAWRKALRKVLLRWGGATVRRSQGFWIDPDGRLMAEPVAEVMIAMDETDPIAKARLRSIARSYGRQNRQKSVYIRFADGQVEFLEIEPLALPAPANDNVPAVPSAA